MTDQELQDLQAQVAALKAKLQPTAQPSTGYGTQIQTPPASYELISVTLPYSRMIDGKWLNWTETYQIADGADAFNALLDRNKAMGKPLNLKGGSDSQGGGYGKR